MSATAARWDMWVREALEGRVVVDGILVGDKAELVDDALEILHRRIKIKHPDAPKRVSLYVACEGGDRTCWSIARILGDIGDAGVEVDATIRVAGSAGLIIAMGARRRVCHERSMFSWHGSVSKPGHDESGKSDEDRAQFMAERTEPDSEWWMKRAETGNVYEFRGAEAVEIGVCHAIE